MDGPIASAVVLPDELQVPASPVHSHKRRQESVSEDNTKRLRLDDDVSASKGDNPTKDTKPVPVRRERGRERRLFGAVLGALSQNSATTAQKRRTEIEKRQLAQRKQDDEESQQRKAERTAKRKEQRWKEQECFEKESMRTRHENLLHTARFLQTKTEPHLYYKPWETSADEEDRIQEQINDAEDIIKREVEQYETRQRRRHTSEDISRDAEGSHTGKNQTAHTREEQSTAGGGTNGSDHSPKDLDMQDKLPETPAAKSVNIEHATEEVSNSSVANPGTAADEPSKDDDDDNGEDVVEEAAEDTVIY